MFLDLPSHARLLALDVYRRYRPLLEHASREQLEALTMLLLQAHSVDGLEGSSRWDSGAYLHFRDAAQSLLDEIKQKE